MKSFYNVNNIGTAQLNQTPLKLEGQKKHIKTSTYKNKINLQQNQLNMNTSKQHNLKAIYNHIPSFVQTQLLLF